MSKDTREGRSGPGRPAQAGASPPGTPASGSPGGGPPEEPAAASEPLAEPGPPGESSPQDPVAEAFAAETMNAERLAAQAVPDYKDRWLRAEAEIQNTRRRALRDRDDAVRAAEERILIDMVEVLDDLERALAALPSEPRPAWAQGVVLTAQRLRDALARRGVTPIDTIGQRFDPAFHEALLEVPASKDVQPGTVAQEVLKGYRRGERALRAARVVVARSDR